MWFGGFWEQKYPRLVWFEWWIVYDIALPSAPPSCYNNPHFRCNTRGFCYNGFMQHNSYVRVRIPSELKGRLKLSGVDMSEVVRVALEAVVSGVEPPPVPPASKETPKKVVQKKPEKKVKEDDPPVCFNEAMHKSKTCMCYKKFK